MEIFSLTYVSSASGLYGKSIFQDIAKSSQVNNAAHSLTGILLVYNETIMQFLEGPEFAVKTLYRKIEQDARHKGPIVVSTRMIEAREFLDWSMGYNELIDINDPNFIFNLDPQTLAMHFQRVVSVTTDALLSSFKRSSGLVSRS